LFPGQASLLSFSVQSKPKVQIPDLPNVYKLLGKTDLTNLNIALLKAYEMWKNLLARGFAWRLFLTFCCVMGLKQLEGDFRADYGLGFQGIHHFGCYESDMHPSIRLLL